MLNVIAQEAPDPVTQWDGIAVVVSVIALLVSGFSLYLSNKRQMEANTISGTARDEAAQANAIAREAKEISLLDSRRGYRAAIRGPISSAAKSMHDLGSYLAEGRIPGRGGQEVAPLVSEVFSSLGSARAIAGRDTPAGEAIGNATSIVIKVLEVVATYRSIPLDELKRLEASKAENVKQLAEKSLASLRASMLYLNEIPTLDAVGEEAEGVRDNLHGLAKVCSRRLELLEEAGFKGVLFRNEELLIPRIKE